jgi:pyridoxine 5-phosphate synthase
LLAEQASADFITLHLRQDRRHIQDRDVEVIRYGLLRAGLNLQVAPTKAMLEVVAAVNPAQCCFVAEPPLSKSASAVLNVIAQRDVLKDACQQLRESGIAATLAVDAQAEQLDAAADVGALGVQLDTSAYAKARGVEPRGRALQQLAAAAQHASDLGLTVTAGGGISYQNVLLLAGIRRIETLHIGHAVVARAVLEGMLAAVTEMRRLITSARDD